MASTPSLRWLFVLPCSAAAAAAALHAAGCVTLAGQDCMITVTCPGDDDAGMADAPAIDCSHPPMGEDGGPDPTCGVFACPSGPADANGTQAKPYPSLATALGKAAGKPVYACNNEAFTETGTVTVPLGATVYGGLDTTKGWAWTTTHTKLTVTQAPMSPGGSEIAMLLDTGTGKETTTIEDLDVTAPDGNGDGVSSIAVVVNGITASLARCTFTAGAGTSGASGAAGSVDPTMLQGLDGTKGNDLCTGGTPNTGPMGPSLSCAVTGGQTSMAGAGGDGAPPGGMTGGAGGNGAPLTLGAPKNPGKGGSGETAGALCTDGSPGDVGDDGMPGPGAPAGMLGTISTSGFTGVPGSPGMDGAAGFAGGGGGGALGGMAACGGTPTAHSGAAGGSGGTGGCGGQHGAGGHPGGSSIALLSLMATLTLTEVELVAQGGGTGGNGGDGETGGPPGSGQLGGAGSGGSHAACSGGNGGKGGAGGPGGGGMGGHSIGVAYTGSTAPNGAKISVASTAAAGGQGGKGNEVPGQGAPGRKAPTLQFP
jgi:hypothetical protein